MNTSTPGAPSAASRTNITVAAGLIGTSAGSIGAADGDVAEDGDVDALIPALP
jgi:hypothetical protein